MQNIIIEKPYKFVPPHESRIWRPFVQMYVARMLRRDHGVTGVEFRGVDRLAASLNAGHGILLTPNHCRPVDPFVLCMLSQRVRQPFFFMASWHLFMQNWWTTWIVRRMGAFSVYREGMDRAAVDVAIHILGQSRRPLVIFPEGVITRTNDHLNALMEGTAFIAKRAAKKKAEKADGTKVVIHPVAIRYLFQGNIEQAVDSVLSGIETRLTWREQRTLPLYQRLRKVGEALLCLKEVEYLNAVQAGSIGERLDRLIDHLLVPLEQEWLDGKRESNVVARVKKLRVAILPDMVAGEVTEEERERRWRQLADLYLAQQLVWYPPDYVRSSPTVDRVLETVERIEEDMTDETRVHSPIRSVIQIDEAIEVSPTRERSRQGDPLMQQVEERLQSMLAALGKESKIFDLG